MGSWRIAAASERALMIQAHSSGETGRQQTHGEPAGNRQRSALRAEHRLPMAGGPQVFAAPFDRLRLFDLWDYDGTLSRIHEVLYVACLGKEGRAASPTAAIIDSQSVKGAEKGGDDRPCRLRRGKENKRQEASPSRRYAVS